MSRQYLKNPYLKREQKETLFDALIARYLGNELRQHWIENPAFVYTIVRRDSPLPAGYPAYLLEVTAPWGVIHRQYFQELPDGIEYREQR